MTPEPAWDQGGGNNPPSVSEIDERLYRRGVGYRGRLGGKSAWQSEGIGANSEADGMKEAEGGAALEDDDLDGAIGDALETLDVDHLQDVGRLAYKHDPQKYPYTHLTELTTANYVAGNPLYDILHDGRTTFDGPPLLSLTSLGSVKPVDDTAVTEWKVDMPALTTASRVYFYSDLFTQLTRFTGALPNLQEGVRMFCNSGLTSWDVELPSLTTANYMFCNTKLTEWHIDLPNLTVGDQMFFGSTLASWDAQLPSLTSVGWMFRSTKLTEWHNDLPSLTNANSMFMQTFPLRSFRGDLSKLVDGTQMFYDCSVTSFETTNLDNLETATAMYINVERFDYALPRLRTVLSTWNEVMFGRQLRQFNGTLPALENAPLMFHYCHLDRSSVKRVGDTIRDATGDAEPPPIAIGVDKGLQGQVDAELDLIRAKGWAVTANYNA